MSNENWSPNGESHTGLRTYEILTLATELFGVETKNTRSLDSHQGRMVMSHECFFYTTAQ